MRRLLLLLALGAASSASAGALSTIGTFCGLFPDQCRKGTTSILAAKGSDSNIYMVEVDQTTGLIPVSATATFNSEGTVGAAAPTKALLAGGSDGTNLRALKVETDGTQDVKVTSSALPTGAATLAKQPALGTAGTASADVITVQGIASGTALTVSGTVASSNLPTTADTNSGAAGTSTLRTVLATRHEAAATPLSFEKGNGTNFDAYGTGADGATVPRATLSTRHEAVATPLAAQLSTGSAAIAYGAGAAGATVVRVIPASDSTHPVGRTYGDSVRYTYVTAAVTTSAYVQMIASTAAAINCLMIFDSSGQTLVLAVGGAGSEVNQLIIPPGGLDGCVPLKIAASSRISLKALSATTGAIGEIDITGLQ